MSPGFWKGIHNAVWCNAIVWFFVGVLLPQGDQIGPLMFSLSSAVAAEWAGYLSRTAARRDFLLNHRKDLDR